MKHSFSLKSFLKEFWDRWGAIYIFFIEIPGITITTIIYSDNWIILLILFLLLIFAPIIFFGLFYYQNKLYFEKSIYIRDGIILPRGYVDQVSSTNIYIFYKIGRNVKKYFIILPLVQEYQVNLLDLPDSFQMDRRYKKDYIIYKCDRARTLSIEVILNIELINIIPSNVSEFKIFYLIKDNLNNIEKKKKKLFFDEIILE